MKNSAISDTILCVSASGHFVAYKFARRLSLLCLQIMMADPRSVDWRSADFGVNRI